MTNSRLKNIILSIGIFSILSAGVFFCFHTARADFSNPIGSWTLDSGSGTTASDSSGNNNNGTLLNGPSWVSGRVNQAVQFDGTNDYIRVPDPASGVLDPQYVTVSAWVKPSAIQNSYIVSKGRDCCDSPGQGGYGLLIYSNRLCAGIWKNSDKTKLDACGWTPIGTGNWHHIAMTFDGQRLRVYIDGFADGASTEVNDTIQPSARDLIFGALSHDPPDYFRFAGSLDDVKIFNRALSSLEIQELYNSYNGGYGGDTDFLNVYPIEPTKNYRITDLLNPLPVPKGSSVSAKAAPGEFEPASFVLRSGNEDLSNIQITSSSFSGPGDATIAASKVDIRLVKNWYQAGMNDVYKIEGKYLLPELLVKDDNLVKTDLNTQTSQLRTTVSGVQNYVDITDPNNPLPAGAVVRDAASLQPFSMAAHTNKQVWLTFKPPADARAGDYHGTIKVSVPGKPDTEISVTLKVLPFTLSDPLLQEGIYYTGWLSSSGSLSSSIKNQAQMSAEFQNMRDHGIQYPTIYQPYSDSNIGTRLTLMKQAGLATDKIFELGNETGNGTSTDYLNQLKSDVAHWKNVAVANGFGDVYFYGMDEASGDILKSEEAAWRAVNEAGGKVFVAVDTSGTVDLSVTNYLNAPVLAGVPNSSDASKWHAKGATIFSYGNPQAGVENPEIYRKNYGLALFAAGYDGAMDFAYQYEFGDIWNDFYTAPSRSADYRGHVFAYPTTDGVVDTIQWEGYREAVDDVRYLATLAERKNWSREEARSWISNVLSANPDPIAAREKIIDEIIDTQNVPADINRDWSVNILDFNLLKNDFLKLAATLMNPRSDINGDGQATIKDVGILMSGWR